MLPRITFLFTLLLASARVATPVASADVLLNINLVYSGDLQYRAAFDSAAATWESLLVGYQNGFLVAKTLNSTATLGTPISQVRIEAQVIGIDGPGNVLGQAGPTEGAQDQAGYILTTDGIMQFDSADALGLLNAGLFETVVLHEMAHVLGFGTLWTFNGVYSTGTGEYLGTNARAFWASEFGQTGTPDVELGGGTGTANAHWNEVDGGAGPTGITDSFGRDLRDELMTGWLNPNPWISTMTVASFADIGFTTAIVPEPASLTAAGAAVATTLLRRRRRKTPT